MKNGFASKAYKQVTCTWICQLNNQIKHWVDVNTEASIVEHSQDYHFSEKGKKKIYSAASCECCTVALQQM